MIQTEQRASESIIDPLKLFSTRILWFKPCFVRNKTEWDDFVSSNEPLSSSIKKKHIKQIIIIINLLNKLSTI